MKSRSPDWHQFLHDRRHGAIYLPCKAKETDWDSDKPHLKDFTGGSPFSAPSEHDKGSSRSGHRNRGIDRHHTLKERLGPPPHGVGSLGGGNAVGVSVRFPLERCWPVNALHASPLCTSSYAVEGTDKRKSKKNR